MSFNLWKIYRKLPPVLQALIAAILSLFLNISVAVVLALIASDIVASPEIEPDNTVRKVLGIKVKKGLPVIELVRNILYVAEDIVTKIPH